MNFINPLDLLKAKSSIIAETKKQDEYPHQLSFPDAKEGEIRQIRFSKNCKGSPAVFIWKQGEVGSYFLLVPEAKTGPQAHEAVKDVLSAGPSVFSKATKYSEFKEVATELGVKFKGSKAKPKPRKSRDAKVKSAFANLFDVKL